MFKVFAHIAQRFVRFRSLAFGFRRHLGGPGQCLGIDILPDSRHFTVTKGNDEDPIVPERPVCGLDFPRGDADNEDPVSIPH